MTKTNSSRRAFVKKAAYVAPAILTLQAFPAYTKAGSVKGPPITPPGQSIIPPGRPITPPGQQKKY